MGAVAGGGVERLLSTCTAFQLPSSYSLLCPRRISLIRRRFGKLPPRRPPLSTSVAAVLGSSPPANKSAENDVLQTFLKERELSGDIITKVSDIIWLRKVIRIDDEEPDVTQQSDESMGDESEGGYLKLTRTHDWVAGDNSAPVNKKMFSKELQNDSDRRKTLNLLRYEALKREMLLLTVGIGTFCSGYCFLALSAQAAMSYGTGVLFSCIYLQLLYKYVDNLSKEMVPQIFRLKKSKKIGIRSQDLKDMLERSVQGSGISLSSPRLVIPAAIYGLWGLSQHFASDLFDFQLVPAMVGMFAYKAAALVQVYRDNEDLRLIFPEDGEGSSE